jgi:probable rRNA maturation factor
LIVLEHAGYTSSALRLPELRRFLTRAKRLVGLKGDVTVLLADDTRVKDLNRTFRRKNKATDVLSFPAGEGSDEIAGDLAISLDTAEKQAASIGHTLYDEVRVLTLHGLLHLAGLDHEVDEGEMAAKELELRAKLELPGSLIERVNRKARGRKLTPAKTAKKRVSA